MELEEQDPSSTSAPVPPLTEPAMHAAPPSEEPGGPATLPEAEGSGEPPGPGESARPEGEEPRARPEPPPRPVQAAEPPAPVEPRPRRGHVAPAMIALERIDEDETYRIRPEGDTSLLATDIARVGQLFPVDVRLKPPDRFQVICGFRRVAALKFLQRERIAARLHTDLSDEDALLMALASAIHARPVAAEELQQVRGRLEEEGRLTPALRDMLEKALSPDEELSPETVDEGPEEVDADELADDVTLRLGEINQDLALRADVFHSLEPHVRAQLLEQLRYSAELVAFLEGR
jgi:ParB family transcriptional regulator, chromosome partitioning protein